MKQLKEADCLNCRHLRMQGEQVEHLPRVLWWCCAKGVELQQSTWATGEPPFPDGDVAVPTCEYEEPINQQAEGA
jgi:hypothetical protein